MSSTTTGGRLRARAARMAAATATAGVVVAAGASGALATPTDEAVPEVVLAPEQLEGFVAGFENLPGLELTDPLGTDGYSALLAEPGASVSIAVPELLEVPDGAAVTLSMYDPALADLGPEGPSFSSDDGGLLVSEGADGDLEVVFPSEEDLELEKSEIGILEVPVTSDVVELSDGTVPGQPSFYYVFDFVSDDGKAAIDLAPVLVVASSFDGASVVAGQPFDLVLPEDSRLAKMGVVDLEPVVVALRPADGDEEVPAPAVELLDDRTARVTVPAGMEAGSYWATVVLVPQDADGEPLPQVASTTTFPLEVAAAPAPAPTPSQEPVAEPTPSQEPVAEPTPQPTRPAVNPGLRSNTGVEEAEAGSGRDALLLGGGLALVAAAGATAAATRRRSER